MRPPAYRNKPYLPRYFHAKLGLIICCIHTNILIYCSGRNDGKLNYQFCESKVPNLFNCPFWMSEHNFGHCCYIMPILYAQPGNNTESDDMIYVCAKPANDKKITSILFWNSQESLQISSKLCIRMCKVKFWPFTQNKYCTSNKSSQKICPGCWSRMSAHPQLHMVKYLNILKLWGRLTNSLQFFH